MKYCNFNFCVGILSFLVGSWIIMNHFSDGQIRQYFPPPRFHFKDITPELCKNKIIIITGANVGLGLAAAEQLAVAGATVVMTAKNHARGADALATVQQSASQSKNGGKVVLRELELGNHHSIKKFAQEFLLEFNGKLDVLMLNAGVMAVPWGQQTDDGFEIQIGINHIGHFYLTKLLTPALLKSAPSRVVSVSSMGHFLWDDDDMKFDEFKFNHPIHAERKSMGWDWKFYGRSKLANVLHMKALSRHLNTQPGKVSVYCNVIHPGGVKTNLGRNFFPPPKPTDSTIIRLAKTISLEIIHAAASGMTPEWGSLTQIYAAISNEIVEKQFTGEYFVPIARLATPSKFALNETLAEELFKASEEFVKGW
jgi:retinol dehydrogenase-12